MHCQSLLLERANLGFAIVSDTIANTQSPLFYSSIPYDSLSIGEGSFVLPLPNMHRKC